MQDKIASIQPPTKNEQRALRLMIILGVIAVFFFLYSLFQRGNISYYPMYVLLMITMIFYCLKYLHEWYHYFSISSNIKPETDRIYSVDILTTYCAGEPFDMLEETLTAIQAITYPHTAWCCDEADDPTVKALCTRLGVKHVTRTIKVNAKAGNINNALQYATGELCVVLDPDHIPVPQFLDRVVAYFDDQSIGYVQVVQAYYNQTESLVAKGAAQQTYQFYGPMMMGMNSYGTVQAIGANCTFRRSALDSIGGHAAGLSEDMHTAMQMHAKGWKSIYVPEILTRGLVPATLSSYFKQQLKWSRGTWELLFVTYPRLFTKFNWRQKIHYATLPFHYLSGFIFIINFLIPVISLFTGHIPLRMDIVSFALAAFPVFAMSILIRHYVQKYVAEESDRGFHLVGGILQIGAWWIFSIGVIYTIFRKKVPYIPTPKNDNEPLPLILNLPNLIIALVSAASIVYGIAYDYTPYTIFMVVLASMQIMFMVFIFLVSGYTNNMTRLDTMVRRVRAKTWLIEKAHGFLRTFSVPLSVVVLIAFTFFYRQQHKIPEFLPEPLPGLQVFYKGVHQQTTDGKSFAGNDIAAIAAGENIAIISLDLPWGPGEKNKLDNVLLQKIYKEKSIPMLRWNLWQRDSLVGNLRGLSNITQGNYDNYIVSLAQQAKQINQPLFLFCSSVPTKNKYPVFALQNSSHPNEFIDAWQHIHQVFDKAGADNVIWVWNPTTTATVNGFPGRRYVDWIAVNTPATSDDKKPLKTSFDSFYRPYHQLQLFKGELPVMVFQTGKPADADMQWWSNTWRNIDTGFKEIKSVVLKVSDNQPGTQSAAAIMQTAFSSAPEGMMPTFSVAAKPVKSSVASHQYNLPAGIKSVVYDKGYYWFRNRHTMTVNTIQEDISAMKALGINTVERTMPGLYDKKIIKVLEAKHMNLVPSFWILVTLKTLRNEFELAQQKKKILSIVKENQHKDFIVAWNLGNDGLFTLSNRLFKPDYYYYQQLYVNWLADLCTEIRKIDTIRPLLLDLQWDEKGAERFSYYKQHLPLINKFMLVADVKFKQGVLQPLQEGMAWGKVPVELWNRIPAVKESAVIPAWQDLENTDYVTLDGLLDMQGRKKHWYKTVDNEWGDKKAIAPVIPEIRILKPAKITREHSTLSYHLIYKKGNSSWAPFSAKDKNIRFEWYLVRIDQYGNTMYIKRAGEGPSLQLTVPMEPQYYKLYVEAITEDEVRMVNSTLNIPLL